MASLTSSRLNRRVLLWGLGLTCAATLLGLAGGRLVISHYGVAAIEALIALPLLVALAPRPFVACSVTLVLLCSVPFYTWIPRAHVPGHPPINLGDILLVLTVGATLWRRPWRTWPPAVRRTYLPVGLMLVVAVIPSAAAALHGHVAARDAIAGYKDLLFMTLGLTVALELRGRLWWPSVNFAVGLAAVVGLLSILAAASGAVGHLLTSFDANAVRNAEAIGIVGTTSRIRLPGLFLVYAMTIPTLVLVLLVKDRWRSLRLLALVLMVGAIAVSLNRNMYLGGAAGLLVTLVLGGTRLRHRVLLVVVTLAMIVTIVVGSTVTPEVTNEIGTRFESGLTTQVLNSNSLQGRADEFAHGLSSIRQHPWLGVGWFQPYGSYYGDVPRQGIEDWYLDLATDLGVPVDLVFLIACAGFLSYGVVSARRATEPLDRAMVAAGVGTLTALLLSCLVGTYLQDPNSMTAFGFACGFLVAAGLRAAPVEQGDRPIRDTGGSPECA